MTKKYINQLSYDITGCAIRVHKALGPGLLESVYQNCLKYELNSKGFKTESNVEVQVTYENLKLGSYLRVDLLVEDLIILELKAVENILAVHEAQLLTYMRLLQKPQGILFNFYTTNIVNSMKPRVNTLFSDLPD